MIDVSIIIVNYNTRELIKDCLASVYSKTVGIDFEVIVSDNGSTDGSIAMIESLFPKVILIKNGINLGFGAANNRGLEIATGKYIFYLNSDTVLINNAVNILFDYWEHSDEQIGALGAFLENSENKCIHSGGFFPTYLHSILSVWSCVGKQLGIRKEKYNSKIIKKEQNLSVDYVIGADLFMLNNSYAKFDERFFMYSEEVDMQFKLAKHSLKRKLIIGPRIMHLCGGSEPRKTEKYDFKKITQFYYWSSLLKFFKKNNYRPVLYSLLKFSILSAFSFPWNIKGTEKYLSELRDL